MTEDNQPSFRLPSVSRKKIPAAFDVVHFPLIAASKAGTQRLASLGAPSIIGDRVSDVCEGSRRKLACGRLPDIAKTSARNRPSRAGRMRSRCARSSASTIDSSMSGAELLEAEWSLISIIQSTLWRGTNRNHRQREVVDERADSFIAKRRLPCDDGVQSADRRARNLGEAAGAPPITPAKSGYSAASKAHPSPNSVQTPCDTRFADR